MPHTIIRRAFAGVVYSPTSGAPTVYSSAFAVKYIPMAGAEAPRPVARACSAKVGMMKVMADSASMHASTMVVTPGTRSTVSTLTASLTSSSTPSTSSSKPSAAEGRKVTWMKTIPGSRAIASVTKGHQKPPSAKSSPPIGGPIATPRPVNVSFKPK